VQPERRRLGLQGHSRRARGAGNRDRPPAGRERNVEEELLARGLPVPGVSRPSVTKPEEPDLKLPSDAEVDKMISFLEKVWRRLIEMERTVQKDVEKKN